MHNALLLHSGFLVAIVKLYVVGAVSAVLGNDAREPMPLTLEVNLYTCANLEQNKGLDCSCWTSLAARGIRADWGFVHNALPTPRLALDLVLLLAFSTLFVLAFALALRNGGSNGGSCSKVLLGRPPLFLWQGSLVLALGPRLLHCRASRFGHRLLHGDACLGNLARWHFARRRGKPFLNKSALIICARRFDR